MINPWKYLRQNNNNNIEFASLKPQLEITPIQLDQNGNYDPQASLDLKTRTQPRSLWEHLTGRTVSVDNQTINQPLLDYQNQLRNQGFDENTVNGVAQGLNSGNKDIAAKIDELGINKPLSQADIDLAKQGQFNTPTLSTETISQYEPGFFNNFGAGFKENFSTPISANNFGQNTLDDGRRKGFGYRAGEALGSIGRVLESPLGRGLLTAGIVGATGGSGLEALAYGGTAGSLNQQLRNNDRMYRNDLIATQQNALRNNEAFNQFSEAEQLQQLSDIENNINRMRGYVTPDTYNNFIRSQQLRENADWRKFYYDDQKAERKLTREIAQQEREYQHQQDAIKNQLQRESLKQQAADRAATRALTMRGQDLNYATSMANIEARNQPQAKPLSDSQVNTILQMDSAIEDVNRIISTYSDPKYRSYFGASGFIKRNPITGRFDPIVSQMSQDIDLMRKTVAKAKEGGRLTDQDQRYYEKALMNPNLTQDKFIELAKRFLNTQLKQRDITLNNYAKTGKDISNFKNDNQAFSSGKYTVRVKG